MHARSCRAYGNFQPPYEECSCGFDQPERADDRLDNGMCNCCTCRGIKCLTSHLGHSCNKDLQGYLGPPQHTCWKDDMELFKDSLKAKDEQMKSSAFTKMHFEVIAGVLRSIHAPTEIAQAFAETFAKYNPNFNRDRFLGAATGAV